jgi:hypothetical protein
METNTGDLTTLDMWNPMMFVEAKEVGETVEMIYTQTSTFSRTGGIYPYHDERAVKIIFSCVDGRWNKSQHIYGSIIPAQDEYFDFEE